MIAAERMEKRRERVFAEPGRAGRRHDSGDGRLSLLVIVEAADVLKARRAIVQSAGAHVEIMHCIPIADSSRVRLVVELDAGALEETLVCIIGSLEQGELGRVIKARAH